MASAPRAGKEPGFRAQMKGWRTSLLSGGCRWDPNSLPSPPHPCGLEARERVCQTYLFHSSSVSQNS